jgi:hypothetical protein
MKTEPVWWAEARALHAKGLSVGQIGKTLERSWNNVKYALDVQTRAVERAAASARYLRSKIK